VGLLKRLDEATQRVNQLLAEPNQKKMMDAINNLGQAAAGISQLSDQASQAKLPELAQETSATLKSLRAVSERLGTSADSVGTSADAFKVMSKRMSEPGGTLDRIAEGTETLLATGQTLNATLVPRLNRTVDDTGRTLRHIGRAVESVNNNPQALLLGNGSPLPGPGEPGFSEPPSSPMSYPAKPFMPFSARWLYLRGNDYYEIDSFLRPFHEGESLFLLVIFGRCRLFPAAAAGALAGVRLWPRRGHQPSGRPYGAPANAGAG
jgi:hypothetical protein